MHLVEDSLATAEQEHRLRQQFPGWQCWAERTLDRVTLWHAAPAGAVSKVIADLPGAPQLAEAVGAYQRALPRHLDDVRALLARDDAAGPGSGMGRARRANLTALRGSLEALQGRLDAAAAVAEAEAAAAAKDAS